MEMSEKKLIDLLVKYNNHCNYDDYTKIVNGGLFQNDYFFIFIDGEKKHTKMNFQISNLQIIKLHIAAVIFDHSYFSFSVLIFSINAVKNKEVIAVLYNAL